MIRHTLVIYSNPCFIETPLKTRVSFSVGSYAGIAEGEVCSCIIRKEGGISCQGPDGVNCEEVKCSIRPCVILGFCLIEWPRRLVVDLRHRDILNGGGLDGELLGRGFEYNCAGHQWPLEISIETSWIRTYRRELLSLSIFIHFLFLR